MLSDVKIRPFTLPQSISCTVFPVAVFFLFNGICGLLDIFIGSVYIFVKSWLQTWTDRAGYVDNSAVWGRLDRCIGLAMPQSAQW